MKLEDLRTEVESHSGTFLCERINFPSETKVVRFSHVVGDPEPESNVPDVGQLREFVSTFGSATFYVDGASGEAAKHIASPTVWASLDSDFQDWLDQLDHEERTEILPAWIEGCLVIGEEPRTGNYLLMPVEGSEAGAVYLFNHDGFEFTREADNIIDYIHRMLAPDDRLLVGIASHMRFVESDPMIQWWIRELQDNRGNRATTAT